MRFLILLLTLSIVVSCSSSKEKDFSELNHLNLATDSLLKLLEQRHDKISEQLYFVSEDSLTRDSLLKTLNLPDSVGFYQYMELSLNEINDIIFQTEQEIYFAKDQLNSVKNEYQNNDITSKEYSDEVMELHVLIDFLKQRIDSNLYFIQTKYPLPKSLIDTLS